VVLLVVEDRDVEVTEVVVVAEVVVVVNVPVVVDFEVVVIVVVSSSHRSPRYPAAH
jgi:hypothetical protein